MKKIILAILAMITAVLLAGCSGESQNYEKKSYTAEAAKVQGVQIDVTDRKIEISPSADGQIHLDYYESEKEYYNIEISDSYILTVTKESNKEWTDYIGSKSALDQRTISLQIPDGMLSSLSLSTTNEDISITPLSVTGNVTADVNNGNLRFEQLDAENSISLRAKNGDISGSVAGSESDYSIACETKKGESNLPESRTGGSRELTAAVNNGDIHVTFVSE